MTVSTNDFNLQLLNSRHFNGNSLKREDMSKREVYSYEIEYFLESGGGIELNDELVLFEKGSVNFRTPGQLVCGVPPYECFMVSFDILDQSYCHQAGSDEQKPSLYDVNILKKIPFKLPAGKCLTIEKIMRRIYKNNFLHTDVAVLLSKADLYLLVAELFKASANQGKADHNENIYILRAVKYIKDTFKEDLKVEHIAESLGLSTNYFQKIFKEAIGISPKRYINQLRIEEAKYFLEVTNIKIEQIGEKCGYFDSVYFSFVFKQHTGITAREYRIINRHKENL